METGISLRLPFPAHNVGFFETREVERVDLRHRNNALSPVGIYHCDITTVAVHIYQDWLQLRAKNCLYGTV